LLIKESEDLNSEFIFLEKKKCRLELELA